jgi:hypothetical protein
MTDQKRYLGCPVGRPFGSLNTSECPASLAEYLPFREPTNTLFGVLVLVRKEQRS